MSKIDVYEIFWLICFKFWKHVASYDSSPTFLLGVLSSTIEFLIYSYFDPYI